MNRSRRMLAPACAGLVVWALAGCGEEARQLVRLSLRGTVDGYAPRLEEGRVELGNDVELYDALMRVDAVRVRTEADELDAPGPVHADLLSGTILLEQQIAATRLLGVELDVALGEGGGVAPGRPASVLAAGFIREVELDYRDVAMDTISVDLAIDLEQGAQVEVRFALDAWFAALDAEMLELDGGRCVIDASVGANAAAAASVEAAIRGSVTVGAGPTPAHPDTEIGGEDELEVELER